MVTVSGDGRFIGVARLKNGFLNVDTNGYKDVKMNLIYHSTKLEKSLICEIQFILDSFVVVKKEKHRIYAIIREADAFQMIHDLVDRDFLDHSLFQAVRTGVCVSK